MPKYKKKLDDEIRCPLEYGRGKTGWWHRLFYQNLVTMGFKYGDDKR